MTTQHGGVQTHRHINDERTVHCPVDSCDATPLARGAHLHVRRSDGNGHGPQGDVPEGIDFESLETAGQREVSMDYPEHRRTEQVARLCPYCEQPFHGKHGVLIHLGQVRGRKNHPESLPNDLDPDEFPIVHVDEHDNIVEIVEEGELLPTTRNRRATDTQSPVLPEKVEAYIETLRAEGKDKEAARAEKMLAT